MTNDFETAKNLVKSYQDALDTSSTQNCTSVLSSFTTEDYYWRGMHPFHEITGANKVATTFWQPFKTAFKSNRRREDIFFAGKNEIDGFKSVWVVSMGHFMGLFDNSFAGIPPSRKISMLRYAEFHQVTDNKITETALFFDMLHLLAQVGIHPVTNQTGMHLVQPGPETHDGILRDKQDLSEGQKTLTLINRMIDDINLGHFTSPQDELRQSWHEDMIWWGPTGIGASYTIERYIDQHQQPFRTQNGCRKFHGHICRMAEGLYGGFFGWPNLSLVPSKSYLGMPPFHGYAEMRIVDIYRRDGNKLAENWIFIDLLHFLNMQGRDVLAEISNQAPS